MGDWGGGGGGSKVFRPLCLVINGRSYQAKRLAVNIPEFLESCTNMKTDCEKAKDGSNLLHT